MRLLVKIGGALLEKPEGRARIAQAIANAKSAGHELLVVHGGGKQIGELATRLGLEEKRHEGLRITDAETGRVVTWVLAGEVNKNLVHALSNAGLRAIGMTGADLTLFTPRRKEAAVDLGYVGTLTADDVATDALAPLLAAGIVPVIATLGPGADAAPGEPFLNVNADEAAGPIAAAAGADVMLMLSDVAGVLDATGNLVPQLRSSDVTDMIDAQVIRDGMIPKVRAALDALDAGVPRVRILSADQEDPIEAALTGTGTEIHT